MKDNSEEKSPSPAKRAPLRRGTKKAARKTAPAKKTIDLTSRGGDETLNRSLIPSEEPKKRRGRPKKVLSEAELIEKAEREEKEKTVIFGALAAQISGSAEKKAKGQSARTAKASADGCLDEEGAPRAKRGRPRKKVPAAEPLTEEQKIEEPKSGEPAAKRPSQRQEVSFDDFFANNASSDISWYQPAEPAAPEQQPEPKPEPQPQPRSADKRAKTSRRGAAAEDQPDESAAAGRAAPDSFDDFDSLDFGRADIDFAPRQSAPAEESPRPAVPAKLSKEAAEKLWASQFSDDVPQADDFHAGESAARREKNPPRWDDRPAQKKDEFDFSDDPDISFTPRVHTQAPAPRQQRPEEPRFKDAGRPRPEGPRRGDNRPRPDERPRVSNRPRADERPRTDNRSRVDERPRTDDRPRMDERPRTDDRPRAKERPRVDDRPRPEGPRRGDNRPRVDIPPRGENRRPNRFDDHVFDERPFDEHPFEEHPFDERAFDERPFDRRADEERVVYDRGGQPRDQQFEPRPARDADRRRQRPLPEQENAPVPAVPGDAPERQESDQTFPSWEETISRVIRFNIDRHRQHKEGAQRHGPNNNQRRGPGRPQQRRGI